MDYVVLYCYRIDGQYAAQHGRLVIDASDEQAAKDRGRQTARDNHPQAKCLVLKSVRAVGT